VNLLTKKANESGIQEESTIKSSVVFSPTTSEKEVEESHAEVIVALKIKEAGLQDIKVAELISSGNVSEAEGMKLKMLEDLRGIEHLDSFGSVTKLIKKGEKVLAELKGRKNLEVAAKDFHNLGYMQECDDAYGYASAEDSDEGVVLDVDTEAYEDTLDENEEHFDDEDDD